MDTRRIQGQEFSGSPIGSRITNIFRVMVRGGITSQTYREILIRAINTSSRCTPSHDLFEMVREEYLPDSEKEIVRAVKDFCNEICPP